MNCTNFSKMSAWRLATSYVLCLLALFLFACQANKVILPAVQGRPLYGVDLTNNLVRFGSMSPDMITNIVPISGLMDGETILGIDFRPADRRLYGLGSYNRLYVIDTLSGGAVPLGVSFFYPPAIGTSFGFDHNPVPDRVRLHSNAQQDLRLDPDTGVVVAQDSILAYSPIDVNAGYTPNIVGTAYTNSLAGAISTTLYAIDSNLGILVTLPSPNNGQLYTVGALGVTTSNFVGFDIAGRDSTAYASLTAASNGGSSLYQIDLLSGSATYIGDIGSRIVLRGLAITP
jgi:hypothetical protein